MVELSCWRGAGKRERGGRIGRRNGRILTTLEVVCKLPRLIDRFHPPGYRNRPQKRLGLQNEGIGGI